MHKHEEKRGAPQTHLTHACSGIKMDIKSDCEEKRDPSDRKPLKRQRAEGPKKETYELDLNIRLEKQTLEI